MNINLKILESDSKITSAIVSALKPQVKSFIDKNIPKIQSFTRSAILQALKDEPEYQSLKTGRLKYEFGLPDQVDVDNIVQLLADTVNIQQEPFKTSNQGLSVSLKLTALEKNAEPAINSADAFVVDNKGGYSLPWLEWLLFKGTQPLVKNYNVRMGSNPYSRSGMAIMVESKKNWRVPSEFAGSVTNNWLSRAIDKIDNQIESQIIKIFQE